MYGIGSGRTGGVAIARVPRDSVEDKSAYEYMTGFDAGGSPVYEAGPAAERDPFIIVQKPAGELSVMYDGYVGEWLMTYLRGGDLIMRASKTMEGPFSKPRLIAAQSDYPGLYGAFMSPVYTEDGGRIIYFMTSIFDPIYNVAIVRAELVK